MLCVAFYLDLRPSILLPSYPPILLSGLDLSISDYRCTSLRLKSDSACARARTRASQDQARPPSTSATSPLPVPVPNYSSSAITLTKKKPICLFFFLGVMLLNFNLPYLYFSPRACDSGMLPARMRAAGYARSHPRRC